MKFYNVEKSEKEKYIYHEFESSYGKISDPLDDYYKEFYTVKEADKHGAERKAINAYEGIREVDKLEVMREKNALKNIKIVSDVLHNGKSAVIENKEIGGISLDQGEAKKNSFGINHIIYERYNNEGKNENEIAALLMLLADTVENGNVSRDVIIKTPNEKDIGRYEIEKNGIIAIVSKQRHGKDEKFVITGFEDINKEEAADAIQTGIARYGYTPEFSYFRKQVGAVVSSLQVSHQLNNKSSEIETARKAGYVQGVCECVAVIGEDHALGKKLLSEMNVSRDMAKKYANPETYKTLEKGIFALKPDQERKQTYSRKR